MDGRPDRREVLTRAARELYPRAKRGLLVDFGAWGDPTTTRVIRRSIAVGDIDYYVLKPLARP